MPLRTLLAAAALAAAVHGFAGPLPRRAAALRTVTVRRDAEKYRRVTDPADATAAAARAEAIFDAADADGDGELSRAEVVQTAAADGAADPSGLADDFFAVADADGDGAVSKAEFVAAAAVSKAEFVAAGTAAAAAPAAAPAPVVDLSCASPPSDATTSVEERLTKQVLDTTKVSGSRASEVSSLADAMSAALRKQSEVEETIRREVMGLRARLVAEIEGASRQQASIMALRNSLESAVAEKNELVSRETELLSQIEEIRLATRERTIVEQLKRAAEQKAALLSIEVMLVADCEDCLEQVEAELEELGARVVQLSDALAAMPEVDADVANAKKYSWETVTELQSMLLGAAQSMAASDRTIQSLKAKIEDGVRQKGQVLGMEVKIPTSVAAGAYGKEIPLGGASAGRAASTVEALSIAEAQRMDDGELAEAGRASAVQAFGKLGRAAALSVASVSSWLKSDDAKQVVQSFKESADAVGDAASAAGKTTDAYDRALRGAKDAGGGLGDGLGAVGRSGEVRSAIGEIGSGVGKAAGGVGQAGKTLATAVASGVGESELSSAVADALTSVQRAITAISTLSARKIGNADFKAPTLPRPPDDVKLPWDKQ